MMIAKMLIKNKTLLRNSSSKQIFELEELGIKVKE